MKQSNEEINKANRESTDVEGALPNGIETGDPERPYGCHLCRLELVFKISKRLFWWKIL